MSKRVLNPVAGWRRAAGFVLIELMLVVAIIGILATVALPAYQDYVARARVGEALELAVAAQDSISEHHARWGSMPEGNLSAGLPTADAMRGRWVQSIQVLPDGVLLMTLPAEIIGGLGRKSADSEPRVPWQLVFRLAHQLGAVSTPLIWVCQQQEAPQGFALADWPASASQPLPDKYLPAACRGTT